MKPSRVRLAVCALLFLGWIGWLVYLSATTTRPVVLSRPQFLAADLYVVAELRAGPKGDGAPAPEATVREVVWSKSGEDLAGHKIAVTNLAKTAGQGWTGPGEYILALSRVQLPGGTVYEVTAIPRSPGYSWPNKTPIYPANATARRELKDLVAEFHPR